MDHYLEIRLLPDPEFSAPLLMGALMGKLHRGLVAENRSDIGVSFPDHAASPRGLGVRMRLHGSAEALDTFLASNWLTGMSDHVSLAGIALVPEDVTYRVVRRVQPKTSAERLRRRQMRRHGMSEQEAMTRIPDSVIKPIKLPFVMLKSMSTGERFPLFVEHLDEVGTSIGGRFNSYGLSDGATIPWF